jgi:formylglycine-generating enzyme required for sulfatase activity
LVIAFIGCSNQFAPDDGEDDDKGSPQEQAQSVSFEPQGGTYSEDISVKLSTDTEGATIHYTIDGSDPDSKSAEYTGPVELAGHGTRTIKAVSVSEGYRDSSIAEARYHIDYLSAVDHREMVAVTGATFLQEDTSGESFEHTIRAFAIGQYEVTYELWHTVRLWAEDHGYTFGNAGTQGSNGGAGVDPADRRQEPVTEVNWYDVVVWANAYSEMAGLEPVYYLDSAHSLLATDASEEADIENDWVDWDADGYRLPTEAEWQYAASYRDGNDWTPPDWPSGGTDAWDGGNENNQAVAWFDDNSGDTTQPVGEKAANQLEIYDMSGNVWEWAWDWDAAYPAQAQTDYRGPGNPGTPSFRVIRGGSWFSPAEALQVGRGSSLLPSFTSSYYGFRLAQTR